MLDDGTRMAGQPITGHGDKRRYFNGGRKAHQPNEAAQGISPIDHVAKANAVATAEPIADAVLVLPRASDGKRQTVVPTAG